MSTKKRARSRGQSFAGGPELRALVWGQPSAWGGPAAGRMGPGGGGRGGWTVRKGRSGASGRGGAVGPGGDASGDGGGGGWEARFGETGGSGVGLVESCRVAAAAPPLLSCGAWRGVRQGREGEAATPAASARACAC
eukprot:6187535-Pleurochrysis_carterae.AAC.1